MRAHRCSATTECRCAQEQSGDDEAASGTSPALRRRVNPRERRGGGASLEVQIDTVDLAPAGAAKVTVTCTTSLGELGVLHLPVSISVHGSAVEVVDTIRGGP